MNAYVIYSLTPDSIFKVESVTFSEDSAKAEVIRMMANEGRARSIAEAHGIRSCFVTYHYEAVKTLDEMRIVKEHHDLQV